MCRLSILICFLLATTCIQAQTSTGPAASGPLDLPDAPSFALAAQLQQAAAPNALPTTTLPRCPVSDPRGRMASSQPCRRRRYRRFINTPDVQPLSVRQKAQLAGRDIIDPFNLLTIASISAFDVGTNAHSAYGPGMRGFARNAGYSLVQDASGEVIGTFAISSIAHEDPRYHRLGYGTKTHRLWHAIEHTYVSSHDSGKRMPNYETLLGYPICAELSNLYVPGVADDAKSTGARIGIGLASNPADDLVAEFLPDIAAHIHLRVVFVQRILNKMATGQP